MIIDLIAAFIITFGFYRGFKNGLIDTIFDTLSILIGIVLTLKFSPLLIDYLQASLSLNSTMALIVGVLILFFGSMLVIRFIAGRLEGLLKAVKLNFINQILGGVVLGFVFAFCAALLINLLAGLNIFSDSYVEQSTLYDYLAVVREEGGWVFETFKSIFTEFWTKFTETIDKVNENLSE